MQVFLDSFFWLKSGGMRSLLPVLRHLQIANFSVSLKTLLHLFKINSSNWAELNDLNLISGKRSFSSVLVASALTFSPLDLTWYLVASEKLPNSIDSNTGLAMERISLLHLNTLKIHMMQIKYWSMRRKSEIVNYLLDITIDQNSYQRKTNEAKQRK